MEFKTVGEWDETLWNEAETVYAEAFPEHGRKPRKIIRSMFEKKMVFLHVAKERSDVIAMALTGKLPELNALLIDYLAVRESVRQRGVGQQFFGRIREWAAAEQRLSGIVIEIESENSETNRDRFRFWTRCGFAATDYIHRYIWVPETYLAMYLPLTPGARLPHDGEALFKSITAFHQKAYRGR
ncbi:GNAT family N-acetyltransferase [Paenibacillus hamazuiensis]|uniref:GNAT family N-acetyltransferase n=1 Tax=Paenibacillus hamazuiensis TaxID=2936508 RepID=UPI00200C60C6|nr:GNAT family N-acetyltransferase [Paenibacillus hamazuiensis]